MRNVFLLLVSRGLCNVTLLLTQPRVISYDVRELKYFYSKDFKVSSRAACQHVVINYTVVVRLYCAHLFGGG